MILSIVNCGGWVIVIGVVAVEVVVAVAGIDERDRRGRMVYLYVLQGLSDGEVFPSMTG